VTRPVDYAEAIAQLRRAQSIALTTHVKPDADALGSIAALRRWLVGLGKTVTVVVPTAPPPKYDFLDPDGAVRVAGRDVDPAAVARPDLVCILDAGTWQQLEGVEPLLRSGAPVLVIDHHRTIDVPADFQLSDPSAPAAATLVYHLLREGGAAMDAETATCLFVGLALDTDWFRLPSTDGATLHLAAALVEAGAQPGDLYNRLYLNEDLGRMRLRGCAVERLRPAFGGRVHIMRLTQEMFRQYGVDTNDTENLINECMRVRGGRVGVMLVEAPGGEIRVSLRCRPPLDILHVAQQFGGGGHQRAAGFRIRTSMDDAEARILEALRPVLAEASP